MGQSETSLGERLRQIAESVRRMGTAEDQSGPLADELEQMAQALLKVDAGHWLWGQ